MLSLSAAGEITKMKAGRQAPSSVVTQAGYTRTGGKAGAETAEGLAILMA